MDASSINLKQIAQSNSDAILVLSELNTVLYMNSAAEDLFKKDNSILSVACAQLEWVEDKAELEFIGDDWEMLFLTAYVAHIFWDGKKARWITLKNRTPQIKVLAEKNKMIKTLELKRAEMELFAFIILNDVRSPLLAMRSFITCLQESVRLGNSAMVQQDLDLVKMSVWTMDERIDQLLRLGKLADIHDEFKHVNLNEVVEEALKAEHLEIAAAGVEVNIVGDPLPVAYGNKERLIQLFQLLINNACKFMGNQKSPKINILHRVENAQSVFSVEDNGVGIDTNNHCKVFDAFYKVNQKTEGSGLGLSLAKTIVGMYKGEIWVDSIGEGPGARFSFTLPLALKMSEIKQFSQEQKIKEEVATGSLTSE